MVYANSSRKEQKMSYKIMFLCALLNSPVQILHAMNNDVHLEKMVRSAGDDEVQEFSDAVLARMIFAQSQLPGVNRLRAPQRLESAMQEVERLQIPTLESANCPPEFILVSKYMQISGSRDKELTRDAYATAFEYALEMYKKRIGSKK